MKKNLQNRRKANIRGSFQAKLKQITDSTAESYYCLKTNGWWFQMVARMERDISYLSIAFISDDKAKA